MKFIFRIRNKTSTTTVDGASNYKKSFEVFGAQQIGEANPITVAEIQKVFVKAKKQDEYEEIEEDLRAAYEKAKLKNSTDDNNQDHNSTLADNQEFSHTSLEDLWDDSDLTLPRRIRCATHNCNLTGKPDFKGKRQKPFWNKTPHTDFKSKFFIPL